MNQAFDVDTDTVIIGTCHLHWTTASDLQLGTLRALQYEVADRLWIPVTLADLQRELEDRTQAEETSQKCNKSWSSIVEAISRCVAAFQKAKDSTDSFEIRSKIIDYGMILVSRIPPWRGAEEFLHILHEFIANRAGNLALKAVLDQFFASNASQQHAILQDKKLNPHQRTACIDVLHACFETIEAQLQCLRNRMIH